MTEQTTHIEHPPTTESWKQWEGRVIDGDFLLLRYLGGSLHSAVFLTNDGAGAAQTAAIKLILDETGKSEQELKRWELAAGLSHPNLLSLFQAGRCQLDGVPLLYVVMEYADEDLSQILPQRALTPSEARETLRPALDALAYLHGLGLVHGRIKPANIMASGNRVKLSSDGLCRVGEPITGSDGLDSYNPPEKKSSPAADAWALGMTLVEVLTRRLPVWERSEETEPAVPDTLAEPFLQIARRCLRRNPSLRLKASDIASRLEPLPAQELPQVPRPKGTAAKFHYIVWVIAIGMLFAAIMVSSIRLKRHPHARGTPPTAIEKPATPKSAGPAVHEEVPSLSPVPSNLPPAVQTESRAPIPPETEEKIPASGAVTHEGIHQVLPDVPQKARDTIQGTVRVSVKVSVDPSGRVTEATLDSPGPSRYFANLALQAALHWTFGPADAASPSSPREWILHFAFSASDTRARSVQAVP